MIPSSVRPHLNETLLQRLLHLLYDAKAIETSQQSVQLTWKLFDAILETSMHSPDFWASFHSHLRSKPLLRELLLEDSQPVIRRSIQKQISGKCTFSPR